MTKLITTIVPENNMPFSDVTAFETDSYQGFYNKCDNGFVLIPKGGIKGRFDEFSCYSLGCYDTLAELDEAVYDYSNEHIEEVYGEINYRIEITEG